MPRRDRYIEGVSNYCDRWCERCPLTARCRLFTAERRLAELEASGRDIDNAAFWAAFDVVVPPDVEWDETDEEDEPWRAAGDGDADDEEGSAAATGGVLGRARHPLAEAGMGYGLEAHRWLREHEEQIRTLPAAAEGIGSAEAFDVLCWYCLQIGVKLSRALAEPMRFDDEEPWALDVDWRGDHDEIDEALAEADRTDRAGSAKVALIGIERSIGAWTVLRDALPGQQAAIVAFQRRLARLRRAIDHEVPEARTFVRPGFDD